MKKLIAMMLALVMVLGLAACGNKDDGKNETKPNASNSATGSTEGKDAGAAKGMKVSVMWYDYSDAYMGTVRKNLDEKLTAMGVDFDNQDGKNDQATQIDQVRTAVAGGANLLVVNQVNSGDSGTAEEILSIAGNVPVIFINRVIGEKGADVKVLNDHETSAFVGTDAPVAGHMQGKMIGDYLVEHFDEVDVNKDGKISYAMFMGQLGNTEAIARTQFSVEDANKVLTEAGKPELEFFDAKNTDKFQVDPNGAWSTQAAVDFMQTNFAQFNEDQKNMIEVVIANNDGMALGAVTVLQEKGYNKEGAHTVPVFGVDAIDDAKVKISEGAMTGSIMQDAEGMATAIAELISGVAGGSSLKDAAAAIKDERISLDPECATKVYVAYAPYTGK